MYIICMQLMVQINIFIYVYTIVSNVENFVNLKMPQNPVGPIIKRIIVLPGNMSI